MKSEKKSFVKNRRFNAVKKLKEKEIIAGDIEHVIESQLPVDPLETVKSLQSGTEHEKLLSCLAIQRFSADKTALKELMKANVLDAMLDALAAANSADVTIAVLDSITAIASIDRGFALELLKRNVLQNFPQLIDKVITLMLTHSLVPMPLLRITCTVRCWKHVRKFCPRQLIYAFRSFSAESFKSFLLVMVYRRLFG
jgi:hypothetical protein